MIDKNEGMIENGDERYNENNFDENEYILKNENILDYEMNNDFFNSDDLFNDKIFENEKYNNTINKNDIKQFNNYNDDDYIDEDFEEDNYDYDKIEDDEVSIRNNDYCDDEYDDDDIDDDEDDINNNDDDINDDDKVDVNDDSDDFDKMFLMNVNKHKIDGTHSLKKDIIFQGRDNNLCDDDFLKEFGYHYTDSYDENYNIEIGTSHHDSLDFYGQYYKTELSKDIYNILKNKTNINFLSNRRKPNKELFNEYYEMCLKELKHKYMKSEIFVELSYYFSDNIFNMFKLLNKKNATGIIMELKEKGYLKDIGNINFL